MLLLLLPPRPRREPAQPERPAQCERRPRRRLRPPSPAPLAPPSPAPPSGPAPSASRSQAVAGLARSPPQCPGGGARPPRLLPQPAPAPREPGGGSPQPAKPRPPAVPGWRALLAHFPSSATNRETGARGTKAPSGPASPRSTGRSAFDPWVPVAPPGLASAVLTSAAPRNHRRKLGEKCSFSLLPGRTENTCCQH